MICLNYLFKEKKNYYWNQAHIWQEKNVLDKETLKCAGDINFTWSDVSPLSELKMFYLAYQNTSMGPV